MEAIVETSQHERNRAYIRAGHRGPNGTRLGRHDPTDLSDGDCSVDDDPISEDIDIVVSQIKRLARTASLEFALRVGGVIIHHFYNGDADAWRSRGPKVASFRRLAQHPELPLSAGCLYRCVALYELCDRLNAPSRWEHLGASHLRMVLGLSSGTQEKLLAKANAERWTVKVLRQEALREKAARVGRGGRRPQPPITKILTSVTRCLGDYPDAVDQMTPLSSRELDQSLQLVDDAIACLRNLAHSLHAAKMNNE